MLTLGSAVTAMLVVLVTLQPSYPEVTE
jgi:hypothetical protein